MRKVGAKKTTNFSTCGVNSTKRGLSSNLSGWKNGPSLYWGEHYYFVWLSSLNVLLYLGLPLRVLKSSELAAKGESLPSSPNPLLELFADNKEDNSALRDALEPPVPLAFLVEVLSLSISTSFSCRPDFEQIAHFMDSL